MKKILILGYSKEDNIPEICNMLKKVIKKIELKEYKLNEEISINGYNFPMSENMIATIKNVKGKWNREL